MEYAKSEIIELLNKNFDAKDVYQIPSDYDDEYHIKFKNNREKHIEVVSLKEAISNEADFGDALEFYKNLVEAFVNNEEIVQIGAYTKLAENLFWREF
mgnify:CR=1 FL=1